MAIKKKGWRWKGKNLGLHIFLMKLWHYSVKWKQKKFYKK